MAADIYTKGFVDKVKWESVCGLIMVIDPKLLMDRNYVRLYMIHAPPSDGGIPKRIETPEGLPSKAGWNEDESGRPVCVVKEAKQFRMPEFKCDPKVWMFRTMWLLQNSAWVKVENRVRWKGPILRVLISGLLPQKPYFDSRANLLLRVRRS